MCDKNIVAMAYNHGGTRVITTNTEKIGRIAREMAEVQRDSYEAFTENLAAAQSRSIGLANDGLKFMRLQEDNARAAQEWFANGVKLLQLQQRNAEFVQGWTGDAVEVVREQSEHNVRTAEAFARSVSKQQESLQALSQGWGLQGVFLPLRLGAGGHEDLPAGHPAGAGGHRAIRPAGTAGHRAGHPPGS